MRRSARPTAVSLRPLLFDMGCLPPLHALTQIMIFCLALPLATAGYSVQLRMDRAVNASTNLAPARESRTKQVFELLNVATGWNLSIALWSPWPICPHLLQTQTLRGQPRRLI
ncbi:hypothetical protein BDP67DRAFT_534835 [Colletotrichum lupini]|nr:hypothetical protein BDP67DRAFT_534835 [Colletotrichum lupini]